MYIIVLPVIMIMVILSNAVDLKQTVTKSPLVDGQKQNSLSFTPISDLQYTLLRQLERCYLWSKTMPFQQRMDYLITLRRKVITYVQIY